MKKSIELYLSEFAKLEKNWDSYNGEPPSEKALEIAGITANFLTRFTVLPSQLTPTPDGGVTLELHIGGGEFSISINSNGLLDSMFISGDGPDCIEFSIETSETLVN